MPDSLWLLPILGGYYFITRFVYKKYKYARLETQRLIFDSIIAGVLTFLIVYVLRTIFTLFFTGYIENIYRLLYLMPIEEKPFLWTFLFGFLLTVLTVKILNWILREMKYFGWNTPVEKAVDNFGDEIEQLFKKSAKEENLIQITLKNNKVYVGFVDYIPPPKESNYLKIIPVISGYRNSETKIIKFTTNYYAALEIYQSNDEKQGSFEMDITLKQDEIFTANVFDYEVYNSFNKTTK